jgi:hypothetical protein
MDLAGVTLFRKDIEKFRSPAYRRSGGFCRAEFSSLPDSACMIPAGERYRIEAEALENSAETHYHN